MAWAKAWGAGAALSGNTGRGESCRCGLRYQRMADTTQAIHEPVVAKQEAGFVRAIGLFDGTMIVVGSMIGSGIFILAAGVSRQTGSRPGLLLTWILSGCLTGCAPLSCGDLAS